MGYEELRRRSRGLEREGESLLEEAEAGQRQAREVRTFLGGTRQTLEELTREFQEKTALDARDQAVLLLAIALQIARQYCLTAFPERMGDQAAARATPGKTEEHSSRRHRLYHPSLEEVLTNPVPFDANVGADGALAGGGVLGHRATAIGHDPILGLIFGTANIATSTLTTASLASYHIRTGKVASGQRDVFAGRADTGKVLFYTQEKLLHGDAEERCIVAASLCKEVVHLRSDLYTERSLPLPLVSRFSPALASDLAVRGLDMANAVTVGRQAGYAAFINALIALFHSLFFDGEETGRDLYEVRTRKILLYSNLAASSSNLAVTAVTRNLRKLDLGGLAVTLHRLVTDPRFIAEVKRAFLSGRYFGRLDQI